MRRSLLFCERHHKATELINEIFDVGKWYTHAIVNDQNVGEKKHLLTSSIIMTNRGEDRIFLLVLNKIVFVERHYAC